MSRNKSNENESVFVVVPAYNEASVIRSTLQPLIGLNYSIVVVDDGSSDNTWSIVKDLSVYALRHPFNLGAGAAVQTGMAFALRNGAEIIVLFDADGQHRVDDIDTVIEPLRQGECDVVFGSRFLRESDKKAVPLLRRILLRGAVIVDGLMTGLWLTDSHNGFRALTAKAAKRIYLRENGYAHCSELYSQVHSLGLRFVEMPTRIIYSEYSRAKGQPAWNAFNILIDLLMGKIFK